MKLLVAFFAALFYFFISTGALFAQSKKAIISSHESSLRDINNQQIIDFAKTVIGTPYVYASTDPKIGFDCSGFISYVYNHFKINVPRSSVDFTDYGEKVEPHNVVPGDLILFTGTDSTIRIVGHMGIVVQASKDSVNFIHCTSGKAHGVTITPLNTYYQGRFMMFKRIPLK